MKRKVRVWFKISPELKFETKETYSKRKITPEYEDEKLVGFSVEVELNFSETNEKAKEIARAKIFPLLERIRYLTGIYFEEKVNRIQQIDPPEVKAEGYADYKVSAVIFKPSSMPKEHDLDGQDVDTTCQLRDYNKGNTALETAERIKNFYLVIEREVRINPSYTIPRDLRCTRHAVSHYALTKPPCKQWLISKIGTNSINYNNTEHLKFLCSMLSKLQQEAKKILDQKL